MLIYRNWAERQEELPFFLHPWWMETVCPNQWDVELVQDGEDVLAVMPYMMDRRWGMSILRTPVFTPHSGPWLKPSQREKYHHIRAEQDQLMRKLCKQLPNHQRADFKLDDQLDSALSFVWSGFEEWVGYTHLLDIVSTEEVGQNFNRTNRKQIAQPEYEVLNISIDECVDFIRANNSNYNEDECEALSRIGRAASLKNMLVALSARKEDKDSAVLMGIRERGRIYLLASAVDTSGQANMAFTELIWHVVQFEGLCRIDFMGSMDQKVANVFRGLGARPVRYSRLRKSILPYI